MDTQLVIQEQGHFFLVLGQIHIGCSPEIQAVFGERRGNSYQPPEPKCPPFPGEM